MIHLFAILSSNSASGLTQLDPPDTPAITGITDTTITFSWNDIANESGYSVQIATNSGFTTGLQTVSKAAGSTSHTFTGLNPSTTYYVRGKSVGDGINYSDSGYTTSISDMTDASGGPVIPFDLSTATAKVVDINGTIGVDCDYNTITAALAAITDNDVTHQYKLLVQPGTYDEDGTMGFWGDFAGMTLKHYIHIIGQGAAPEDVLITGPEQLPANEDLADVFHIPATCLIQNVKVRAHNNKYCFHCDYTGYEYQLYIKDCDLGHLGTVSGYSDAIGCGMYGGQKVIVINTTMPVGTGFYAHGDQSTSRNLAKHFEIELYNCDMPLFLWQDYIEYAANKITLTNNTIGTVDLRTVTTVYDANPGDPACNTGTKVYTNFINSGNTVSTLIRDSETATILGTTMDDVTDFN